MTARDLVVLLRRRWYVVVATLLISAAVAMVLPWTPGVYYSRVDVAFIPPNGPTRVGNALEGENENLVHFAAVVQRQLNGSRRSLQLSSEEATLYGAGVRQGYTMELANPGGQWQSTFDRPVLRIEVVDTSEARVRQVVAEQIGRIQSTATADQDASLVPVDRRIRTVLTQAQPTVTFVPGNVERGLAVFGLLSLGLGIAASVVVDRAGGRRRQAGDWASPKSAAILRS